MKRILSFFGLTIEHGYECQPPIDAKTRAWFIEKARSNSDFIEQKFVPMLEQLYHRNHHALHEANRKGTLEEIKQASGRLDGVHEVLGLLSGLRMSEAKNPGEGGSSLVSSTIGRLRGEASRR